MAKSNIIAYVVQPEFGTQYTWGVDWANYSSEVRDTVLPITRGERLSVDRLASMPRQFWAKKIWLPRSTPPDIIGNPSGPYLFSQKAKRLLETLEPDVHQFIEIEVSDRDTRESYGTRHLVHLSTRLDCIDYEGTQFGRGHGEENGAASGFDPYPGTPMLVYQPLIEGHHFWRGGGRARSVFFISAQLGDLLKSEGIHGLELKHWCVPSSKDTAKGGVTRH